MANRTQRIRYWAPAIVWAGLIFMASSLPAPEGPSLWEHQDKIAHALVFGMLAFLLCRALQFSSGLSFKQAALGALALTALYGALDEGHQAFIPSRSVEFLDWVADTTGALLCLLALWVLRTRTGK